MVNLRQIEREILAAGRVDSPELEALRRQLYAGGKVSRAKVEFLVELRKRVQHRSPAFEQFFFRMLKDHVLADDRIDGETTAWLREILLADDKFEDEKRKLLHELKGETKQTSREFDVFFHECMKKPQEQRTCG